jgi:hypothetical protein
VSRHLKRKCLVQFPVLASGLQHHRLGPALQSKVVNVLFWGSIEVYIESLLYSKLLTRQKIFWA